MSAASLLHGRLLDHLQEQVISKELHIILGSESPTRIEILRRNILANKVDFTARASSFPEDFDTSTFTAEGLVQRYAREKADAVRRKLEEVEEVEESVLLICGDTVVELDGKILEKPVSKEHAAEMLRSYRNKVVNVRSGICIILFSPVTKYEKTVEFVETTQVYFCNIEDPEIDGYLATDEYKGKAGAFGIQGSASQFITKISGCYFNVLGLPVHRTSAAIASLLEDGVRAPSSP